jgi:hypothetical protein
MRKLTLAVALALAAMAADAATVPRSSLPGAANATSSANGSLSGAPITNSVPTAATGGTGTTTGNTTTTTTTTTPSPAATATNGASLNRALSATVTNSGSLGSAIPGNSNNGLASTLANGASLSSPTGTATTGSIGNGTNNGPFTNGGVGGIVTIDNGGGSAVNGVNANGEIVGGTFAQAPAQQQLIVQQQSALTPELTALERRELRKRNNVPANKQLLNSVAPRTNVDRTWQMPDDPPSPALSTSPLR